jgi:hypothetical protein
LVLGCIVNSGGELFDRRVAAAEARAVSFDTSWRTESKEAASASVEQGGRADVTVDGSAGGLALKSVIVVAGAVVVAGPAVVAAVVVDVVEGAIDVSRNGTVDMDDWSI